MFQNDILLHFQTRGGLKFEWCFKRRQILHFLIPVPVKIREGWARFLYQLLKLYLRPNLRNTFDGCPLRGCWEGWIDKKEKSLWVKLKAFPTNVGRPNKVSIFKAGASKLVCFLSLSHDSIKMCKFKSTAANIYTRTETGDKLASVLQIFRPLDVVQELRKAL